MAASPQHTFLAPITYIQSGEPAAGAKGLSYCVFFVNRDHKPWEEEVRRQITSQALSHRVSECIELLDGEAIAAVNGPSLIVFFGGDSAIKSKECCDQVKRAIGLDIPVIPVVDPNLSFSEQVPSFLSEINAFKWVAQSSGIDLAALTLRELGITESRRQLFVSYRRSDGTRMSDQLFDALRRRGFEVFLDRFDVAPGDHVQARIRGALEDVSFVLLIESQDAHNSNWVFWEVQYALQHHMGILIVTLPSVSTHVPGTDDLPHEHIAISDLLGDASFHTLTQEALEHLVRAIEFWHADGLLRRRRNMLTTVVQMSKRANRDLVELPDWKILITDVGNPPPFEKIIAITPRTPRVDDLWELDRSSDKNAAHMREQYSKVLVFPSEYVPVDLRAFLDWAAKPHGIELTEIQRLPSLLGA